MIIISDIGLPAQLQAQYFTRDIKEPETLTEAERSITKNFSKKRLSDFSTGRYCAREALKLLQVSGHDILIGTGREPLWPKGITGAISHCSKLTGAVVAKTEVLTAIGLDIEVFGAVKTDMWPVLFTDNEIAFLNQHKQDDGFYPTLFFSIKESFYKMQYPLTRTFLEFQDVEITPAAQGFTLSVVTPSASRNLLPKVMDMNYIATNDNLVISYCYLEA